MYFYVRHQPASIMRRHMAAAAKYKTVPIQAQKGGSTSIWHFQPAAPAYPLQLAKYPATFYLKAS